MSYPEHGCDYCYDTMQLCPVCGPFEYAPSESVGYDPDNGKHQAEHVNGWDLSGRIHDWQDSANADGWCWRDTEKFFETFYSNEHVNKLHELMMKPRGLAIGLPR